MSSSNLVGNAVPYGRFEERVAALADAYEGRDIFLVYSEGEWDLRIGDAQGFSETVADSAFECVLDGLEG